MRDIIKKVRLIVSGVAVLTLLGLSGCMTSITYGTPPQIDQLANLDLGVSNYEDVRQKLGEPRGYGAVRLDSSVPLRTIWFYEYQEAGGSRVNLKFLLVYFYQDRYEGYNWFASASLLRQK
jgi:hypothetical protein